MNCGRCSKPLREGARFCPSCGTSVGVAGTRSADPGVAALQAALLPFAELGALRDGPAARPAVAVVGETGRGRTTVATILVDGAVGDVADVRDLPALDDPGTLETEVIPAVLAADVVVIVVTATQLLSATERTTLQHRVLPLCVGEVVLVVTRLDALETEEDRGDLDRRVERFVAGRAIPVFFVARVDGALVSAGLAVHVWEAAQRAGRDARRLWARRVGVALGSRVAEEAGVDPNAVVDTEAALALADARALNHSRMATMRATLPDRLASMPFERMRAEASAVLTGEVQALSHELARSYLAALERELAVHPDDASRASAEGLTDGVAAEAERKLHGVERAPQVAGSRPRSLGAMALGGAGVVAMVAVGGPVGLASGAAMLYGAWATRKEQQARFEARSADDTRASVREWLDENERALDTRLGELSADIVAKIKARLAAVAPPRASAAELATARACVDALENP